MSKKQERSKALQLRKKGMSYSQIKERIGVSKGTLSLWLKDYPLSREQINNLRANSEQRIERFRDTMYRKKEGRRQEVSEMVSKDIENSSNPEFLMGFYLYWGEGTKTAEYSVSLANSDPAMLNCFVSWLFVFGAESRKLRVKLHMYSDQDEDKLKEFWSKALNIPLENFNKSYVKHSLANRKTYKGMFPYGTCTVSYHNRDMYEYVMAGIHHLRQKNKIAVTPRIV